MNFDKRSTEKTSHWITKEYVVANRTVQRKRINRSKMNGVVFLCVAILQMVVLTTNAESVKEVDATDKSSKEVGQNIPASKELLLHVASISTPTQEEDRPQQALTPSGESDTQSPTVKRTPTETVTPT